MKTYTAPTRPLTERVILVLLGLAEHMEVDICYSIVITKAVSKEALAVMANSTPQSISTLIQRLRKQNLVAIRNRRIILLQPDALRGIVE